MESAVLSATTSTTLLADDIPKKRTTPMKMYSLKARPLKTDTVTSSANQLVPFCNLIKEN